VTDTFIQLPDDGTGKKHRSWENTVGSDDVHATAGVITAPDGTVLSDTNGVEVNGNVASGDADTGNPVKVGGRYNFPPPTLTNGDRGDLQLSADGSLRVIASLDGFFVSLQDQNLSALDSNRQVDTVADSNAGLRTNAALYAYNAGASQFVRVRGDTTNGLDVDVTRLPTADTATLSNVATSTTSAVLLSSNAARKGVIVYNDALVVMYLKFGAVASATSFTYHLAAGATLELPTAPVYTGHIHAILASSTGTARVTELT
jgi:hypothetical protein